LGQLCYGLLGDYQTKINEPVVRPDSITF